MTMIQTHRMTLLLDEPRLERLNALAERATISKCAVLRQMIDRAAFMDLNGVPTCANGHRCSCPHLHGVHHHQGIAYPDPSAPIPSQQSLPATPSNPEGKQS